MSGGREESAAGGGAGLKLESVWPDLPLCEHVVAGSYLMYRPSVCAALSEMGLKTCMIFIYLCIFICNNCIIASYCDIRNHIHVYVNLRIH